MPSPTKGPDPLFEAALKRRQQAAPADASRVSPDYQYKPYPASANPYEFAKSMMSALPELGERLGNPLEAAKFAGEMGLGALQETGDMARRTLHDFGGMIGANNDPREMTPEDLIALGTAVPGIAKNLGRKMAGRVMTNIQPPFDYSLGGVKSLAQGLSGETVVPGTQLPVIDRMRSFADAMINDVPMYSMVEAPGMGGLLSEVPYRRGFGLKPRWFESGFIENPDGTISFYAPEDLASFSFQHHEHALASNQAARLRTEVSDELWKMRMVNSDAPGRPFATNKDVIEYLNSNPRFGQAAGIGELEDAIADALIDRKPSNYVMGRFDFEAPEGSVGPAPQSLAGSGITDYREKLGKAINDPLDFDVDYYDEWDWALHPHEVEQLRDQIKFDREIARAKLRGAFDRGGAGNSLRDRVEFLKSGLVEMLAPITSEGSTQSFVARSLANRLLDPAVIRGSVGVSVGNAVHGYPTVRARPNAPPFAQTP